MKENEMVFGIRAVIEAIQADKEIDKILVKRLSLIHISEPTRPY